MKRFVSVLLSALLLASGLTACSDAGENNTDAAETSDIAAESAEEAGAVEPEVSYIDTLGEKNFDGADYVVIVTLQGNGLLHPATTEITGEAINDALFQRDRSLEDRYSVVIQYPEYADSPDTAKTVVNSVLAGDAIGDVYIDALSDGANYMGYAFQQSALYNLADVPYLQLDQEWWSSLMYDKLRCNGKMFFTSGDMACYSFAAPSCTFMNLQVADNNAIDADAVYSLVYEGKWTLDEMIARTQGLHNDLNGDGVFTPEADSYGVVNATISLTCEELLVGAGVEMSGIDENGSLVVDLNNEKVLNTIEKVKQCYCEVSSSDNTNALLKDCFCGDRTLFCVHFVESAINNYREMESDFAILPMPKFDEEQDSYMSYINPHTHSFIAMPLILEDVEKTGFITEVMEYMTVESVRPAIYDITLKGKTARNPDTQAMLDIIFNTTYTEFNAIINFGGSIDLLQQAVFADADFASGYAKNAKVVTKTAEKIMQLFADSEG